MSKRTMTALVVVLLCTLLVSGVALSMSSTNYRLDWFTPLTGGGGGPASSAHYAADVTVGQPAIGMEASASHAICLGYWCVSDVEMRVYLPALSR